MRVFKCSESVSVHDNRIDDHMWKILDVLDGQKNLASIAFASGMNMTDFQQAVKTLIEYELILPVEAATAVSE